MSRTPKPTGRELVRMALERGESLTALEAWQRFDLHSLAVAIHALKRKGLAIEADMIDTPGGARVARYRLAKAGTHELGARHGRWTDGRESPVQPTINRQATEVSTESRKAHSGPPGGLDGAGTGGCTPISGSFARRGGLAGQ